ncbi:MAG: gliding motility-associated C-terminal domain-containing protein [Salinivirgaceae bacterium]|nr:gliding motility-associated C-terminal domain-containing protein [Salinivirgaceae bacterium]
MLIQQKKIVDKGFSPSVDGIGDNFLIKNVEDYPNNEIIIYNRWGTKVFDMKNYDNSRGGKFTQTQGILPAGAYFYVLFTEDGKSQLKVMYS